MFDYIISCYFGSRRSSMINAHLLKDNFYLINEHLKFLNENLHTINDINNIIFTINGGSDVLVNDLKKITEDYSFSNKIIIQSRVNSGYSYAAWNFALEDRLNNNTDSDYAFLCEDDYVPCDANFYNIFIGYFKDDVAYVCQLYTTLDRKYQPHPAISNGFISYKTAREVYSEYNKIFDLNYDIGYKNAELNQINFLNYFKNYRFLDITDNYFSRFLHLDVIKTYGNENSKEIIKPII